MNILNLIFLIILNQLVIIAVHRVFLMCVFYTFVFTRVFYVCFLRVFFMCVLTCVFYVCYLSRVGVLPVCRGLCGFFYRLALMWYTYNIYHGFLGIKWNHKSPSPKIPVSSPSQHGKSGWFNLGVMIYRSSAVVTFDWTWISHYLFKIYMSSLLRILNSHKVVIESLIALYIIFSVDNLMDILTKKYQHFMLKSGPVAPVLPSNQEEVKDEPQRWPETYCSY